jgi:hypothetical protein
VRGRQASGRAKGSSGAGWAVARSSGEKDPFQLPVCLPHYQ